MQVMTMMAAVREREARPHRSFRGIELSVWAHHLRLQDLLAGEGLFHRCMLEMVMMLVMLVPVAKVRFCFPSLFILLTIAVDSRSKHVDLRSRRSSVDISCLARLVSTALQQPVLRQHRGRGASVLP